MSRNAKSVTSLILLITIVLIFAIMFGYHNIYLKKFSNTGEMSAELNYYVEDDYANEHEAYIDNSYLVIYDSETMEEINYQLEDESTYKSEWSKVSLVSDNYVVEHFYNGDNHLQSHLNLMVGDCLYRINRETMTAELVYETKGNSRVLYANDDYFILFNGSKSICQWITYSDGCVKKQKAIDLDLTAYHKYECVYNSKNKSIDFKEYKTSAFRVEELNITTVNVCLEDSTD